MAEQHDSPEDESVSEDRSRILTELTLVKKTLQIVWLVVRLLRIVAMR